MSGDGHVWADTVRWERVTVLHCGHGNDDVRVGGVSRDSGTLWTLVDLRQRPAVLRI